MTTRRRKTITFTLSEALRGTEAGRIQSVGYMQVIPLVSDLADERFVSPVDGGAEAWTTDYGALHFYNPSIAILIIPCHAGYVVKMAVQDHAMSHAGIVPSGWQRRFTTAMCVQDSQPGLIRRGNYRMTILPFPLREQAMELHREKNYEKLWDGISLFNQEMGLRAQSNLGYFLYQFRKELDQFVAEFECIPRQVGAIILINDQVVGVERTPSPSFWKSIWPALIRECYGSLALQVARSRGEHPPLPKTRVPLPDGIDSLAKLSEALAQVSGEEERRTKLIVRELIHEKIRVVNEEVLHGLKTQTILHPHFVGQVILDDERVVYASLIARKKWMKSKEWADTKPFTI